MNLYGFGMTKVIKVYAYFDHHIDGQRRCVKATSTE